MFMFGDSSSDPKLCVGINVRKFLQISMPFLAIAHFFNKKNLNINFSITAETNERR